MTVLLKSRDICSTMTQMVAFDMNQLLTNNHRMQGRVFQMVKLSYGTEWRLVGACLGPVPLHSSHSLGEPVSWGQLGGTVSCLKSSQFTGSFKVSTPTGGPQDYKNYKHWAVQAPIWDTQMHNCTHTHIQLLTQPFRPTFDIIKRQHQRKKDVICSGC